MAETQQGEGKTGVRAWRGRRIVELVNAYPYQALERACSDLP
jgi:hypothetical protein